MGVGSPFYQKPMRVTELMPTALSDGAILGFRQWCVPQPPKSNWCWAAVSKAMVGFVKSEDITLEEIARRVSVAANINQLSESDPFELSRALRLLGIAHLPQLNLFRAGEQAVITHIPDGTPIAATIAWYKPDGNVAGVYHAIAIFGWNPNKKSVLVFDPNTVGASDDIVKAIPISEMRRYLEGAESQSHGTWSAGYVVTRDAD